jgi:ABC-type lipoprotein export system ATPase subunit
MEKNMPVLLKAENIHKTYKLGQARIEVLKGLDLAVQKGQFIAIVGASGSGKSTLLHIMGALDVPDKGNILFENQRLDSLSGSVLNKFRNKKVGFVFQFYHLLDELNVTENAMLSAMAQKSIPGWFGSSKKVKKRAQEMLQTLGLSHRLDHKPYQLSGGERQRVAIARALMNEPTVLLADEPTGNLDLETGNGILKVLEQLNDQGQTIVMVTHDRNIADRADIVMKLVDGKIV